MEHIIVYGSQYGSTRRYAEKLSEQVNIPAISYKQAVDLSNIKTLVYLGGLYTGGVLGLSKTLRSLSKCGQFNLILVTVGLSDPKEPENRENIRTSLQNRLPAELFQRAKIFHLRGGIDYHKLSVSHRAMMKLLYQSLRKRPLEMQTAEDRALIETYGKRVDFMDFSTLEPIIREIQKETI